MQIKLPIHYLFFILMGMILFAEVVIMLLLDQLNLYTSTPWLSGLLDASAVSLLTILSLAFLTYHPKCSKKPNYSSLLLAGVLIFAVEIVLMQLLPLLSKGSDWWQVIFINTILLALLCFPFIYWKVFLPIQQNSIESNTPEDINHSKSVKRKNHLYAYLLFICFLVTIFFVLDHQKQGSLHKEIAATEAIKHTLFENVFLRDLHNAILDSQVLSHAANLKALLNNKDYAEASLQADYLSRLGIMQDYDQLRYIDQSGTERIRVDRHSNQAQVVSHDALQNKQERYYFRFGMQLNEGEVYISPLDLNIERGEIEQPYRPMLRVVSAVFNDSGIRQGIIVINLSAKQMFDKLLQSKAQMSGHVMLLNSEGYWLYGAEEQQSWGFMFKDRSDATFAQHKPNVWQRMHASPTGIIATQAGSYVYSTLSPMNNETQKISFNENPELKAPYWLLVSYIDNTVINTSLEKFNKLLLVIMLLFAFLGAFILHIQNLRNESEQELLRLAHFDNLTGLANRTFFLDMLEHEFLRSQRNGYSAALLYIDLDNFKPINDELGHDIGDFALKETASRLRQSVRPYDHIARIGGDEFVIIMSDIKSPNDVDELAERIIYSFTAPFHLKNENHTMGVSIGITILDKTFNSSAQVLQAADMAMYQAKKHGKNRYVKTAPSSIQK